MNSRIEEAQELLLDLQFEDNDYISLFIEVILESKRRFENTDAVNTIPNTVGWYFRSKELQDKREKSLYYTTTVIRLVSAKIRSVAKENRRIRSEYQKELFSSGNSGFTSESFFDRSPIVDPIFTRRLGNWDLYLLYLTDIEELSVREIQELTIYAKSSINDTIRLIYSIYRSKNES